MRQQHDDLRPLAAYLVDDLLQLLLADAEAPVENEVSGIGDRRVRKRLTDNRDRHSVLLSHHVRRKDRIAEVGGPDVLREKVDTPFEVTFDDLLDAFGTEGEFPMSCHRVDAEELGGVYHVLAFRPQRRRRALPAIAAVEQQCRRTARLQPLDQRGEMCEAANLAIGSCRRDEISRGEGVRVARPRRDAEVAQEGPAHQMRRTSRSIAQAEVDARLAKVRRQQLPMTIREVQQMHVAKARHVVDVGRVPRRGAMTCERETPGGCRGEDLKEFTAIHGNLPLSENQRPRLRGDDASVSNRRDASRLALGRMRHLLTGDCGSISSAVTSLICCSVRIWL